MGEYDVAQICLNGHLINHSMRRLPQFNKKFCDKCGAPTISNCPICSAEIQGQYHPGYVEASIGRYRSPPAFCPNCGGPYPWTEAKIQAAHELAQELEGISDDEKTILTQSIDDIVKDTPQTTLAATRFKRLVSKMGKPVADAFRDILVDIVSETAKKMLWPG
jgi:hypothetical protein